MPDALTIRKPSSLDALSLDAALRRHGVDDRSVRKQWTPWPWEKVELMFGRLDYIPSPGQREFHQSTARTKCLICGARFGKSLSASRDLLPIVLSPDTNVAIIGPTYDLAEKEWRYLESDLHTLGFHDMALRHLNGKPAYYEFPWGSRVWMRSADNPTSLLGEEYDAVLLSEASQLPVKVFERYIRARVGSRLGRIIIPTTPSGAQWIREQFDRGVKQRGKDVSWNESVASFQFSVLENPTFDAQEYFTAAELLPGPVFAEQYDGRFAEMTGRVYPQFARRRHVLRHADVPIERLRTHGLWFRTIDFGWSNPSVCLWVCWDRMGDARRGEKAGTFWFVDEVYERQLLTIQLANRIKENEFSRGVRLWATYGDMADAQARAQLSMYGVPVADEGTRLLNGEKVPIDKALQAGFKTIRTLLHQDRIRISDRCANLIEEFQGYMLAEDSEEPEPNSVDHALDALRYLLHTVAPFGVSMEAA